MSLSELLTGWEARASGTLACRLAAALAEAIERGSVGCGARLPPERDLARELFVSRATVGAAYQMLRERGLVETRERGRSSVLSIESYRALSIRQAEPANRAASAAAGVMIEPFGDVIDLATAPSPPIPGIADAGRALFVDFASHPISRVTYAPAGLPSLRERIAEAYTRSGCPTSAENVVVTSGATQALSLVLAMSVDPGDVVLCEDPTYPGAIHLIRSSHARLHGVGSDNEGPSLDELDARTATMSAKLLFFSPSFNSPTGRFTSLRRRRSILETCSRRGIAIVEDNSLVELALRDGLEATPQSLSAFDADAPVFSIGSVDKSVWTGLRVGWIRAPKRYVRRLAEVKTFADLTTSPISQYLAEQLFDDRAAFAERRRQLLDKLDVLEDILARRLPDWRFVRPDGGQLLWVNCGTSAMRLAQISERFRVRIHAGPRFSVSADWTNYLRVPFGHIDADVIVEGIERLAQAWSVATVGAVTSVEGSRRYRRPAPVRSA